MKEEKEERATIEEEKKEKEKEDESITCAVEEETEWNMVGFLIKFKQKQCNTHLHHARPSFHATLEASPSMTRRRRKSPPPSRRRGKRRRPLYEEKEEEEMKSSKVFFKSNSKRIQLSTARSSPRLSYWCPFCPRLSPPFPVCQQHARLSLTRGDCRPS